MTKSLALTWGMGLYECMCVWRGCCLESAQAVLVGQSFAEGELGDWLDNQGRSWGLQCEVKIS